MKKDPGTTTDIIAIACGPSNERCKCQCPDGPCEHQWDGQVISFDNGQGESVTCSCCGMSVFHHSMWVGP
jgi:hypothetical protein